MSSNINIDEWDDSSFDVILYDRATIKSGKKNVLHRFQEGINEKKYNDMFASSIIYEGGSKAVTGIAYRKEFLFLNNIRFDESCIQGEDAIFNMAVLICSPHIKYINRLGYQFNYSSETAINRWRKHPDLMLESSAKRYEYALKLVKYMKGDSTKNLHKLKMERIDNIFDHAINLYTVGNMTEARKKRLQELMLEIDAKMKDDKKRYAKYLDITSGKWEKIQMYALAKNTYLKVKRI